MSDLFAGLVPALILVVSAAAPRSGEGTAERPFATIQEAVAVARPGTAVLVRAGTYREAIKLPSRAGGEDERPIWLISADGPGTARIAPPEGARAALQGLGSRNLAVIGFEIVGGENGIQVGMSGDPARDINAWAVPKALPRRILVQGNRVHGQTKGDGIKISQAEDVAILDNEINDVAEQCIDFVAVNRGTIARNDCAGARKAAGIFAKGGSSNIAIIDNRVHDISAPKVAGIALGGWTTAAYFRPEQANFELRQVLAVGNHVERVNGFPLAVLGAQEATVEENLLDASASAGHTSIGISHGTPGADWAWPVEVVIRGNRLIGQRSVSLDRSTGLDGRPRIAPGRDRLRLQDASDDAARPARAGPRAIQPWPGHSFSTTPREGVLWAAP